MWFLDFALDALFYGVMFASVTIGARFFLVYLGRQKRNCTAWNGGRRNSALRLESLEDRRLLHGAGDEPHDHLPETPLGEHIHANLSIILEGEELTIPADIGMGVVSFAGQNFKIPFAGVHTEDDTGEIHFEVANNNHKFSYDVIGDFFDVWRTEAGLVENNPDAIFNENQIMDRVVDEAHSLNILVNGKRTQMYEDYIVHDGDDIVIFYNDASAPDAPFLNPIQEVTLLSGSPLHIPLNASTFKDQSLSFTATSDNPDVTTFIPQGNRSMRMTVAEHGTMVFELYEGRVPRVTERIITLAESGFYNGVTFHRVIDEFMIQTGDPTATGSGGSDLGDFDDQYHIDLQHNTQGILSMAKSSDDTNDSQFFITESTPRHLDFNHSIFGLLVEGNDVRESISNVEVDTNNGDKPLEDVVIESVEILFDEENAVLMLKAPEGVTGEANITVAVTDEDGVEFQQTFHVTIEADLTFGNANSHPFFVDIADPTTLKGVPLTIELQAYDVEGEVILFDYFEDGTHDALTIELPEEPVQTINQIATANLTITPDPEFSGTAEIFIFVHDPDISAGQSSADVQILQLTVIDQEVPTSWQNIENQFDVDSNGIVNSIDLLNLIRDVNDNGNRVLPAPTADNLPQSFVDINGDDVVNPLDIALLVAELNRLASIEGEPEAEAEGESDFVVWGIPGFPVDALQSRTSTARSASLLRIEESESRINTSLETKKPTHEQNPFMPESSGSSDETLILESQMIPELENSMNEFALDVFEQWDDGSSSDETL